MGGVELGLQEEGVVTFGGVYGDVHRFHLDVFEAFYELRLFFGIEAEVRVDGEDEEFVTGLFATLEEFLGRVGSAFDDGIVSRPHVDDAEVSVGVEPFGELFTLMEHVALEGVADLEPGEHFFFMDQLPPGASLEGIEVDEGLMGNHTGESEADAGGFAFVVVAAVKVSVVLDGENLLEENEAVEDGGFESAGDGNDVADFFRIAGRKGQGEEAADGGADDGVELLDPEMVEERDLGFDEVGDGEVWEGGSERFSGFRIDVGRARAAVASAEVVGADHEKAVGIDGFARPDHFIPPAFVEFLGPIRTAFGGIRMGARGVMGSRECVEEENGVGLVVVQGAPGRVSEPGTGNATTFTKSEVTKG